jgi:type I restriction enzyme M protein
VKLQDIREKEFLLSPGRYVGAKEVEADEFPFEVRFSELSDQLEEHFLESARLSDVIRQALTGVKL